MSYGHGNYRRIHWKEAIREAKESDSLLVGLDDVIIRWPGKRPCVEHIVAPADFYTMDEPVAYMVQLDRPMWFYGDEGLLYPIKFVGYRIEWTWDELTDGHPDSPTEEEWDLLPESNWLWMVSNHWDGHTWEGADHTWKRCDAPYWEAFRD